MLDTDEMQERAMRKVANTLTCAAFGHEYVDAILASVLAGRLARRCRLCGQKETNDA